MFPCPSPSGRNDAGLYLDRAGNLVDRNGALWGRRNTMAMDSLPESVRAPHVPSASDDAEARVGMLKHILRGYGLDDKSCDEACQIARNELAGEVSGEDYIPASGLKSAGGMGGRLSGERSRLGEGSRPSLGTLSSEKRSSPLAESEYRASPASDASFDQRYPGVRERLGRPVHGNSQYDPPSPLRKRERKAAADARTPDAGDRLAEKFGEHFAEVGVGEWPRRR